MSKHSSPPWTTRVATGTCDTLISSPDGLVATIRYETGTPERRTANARLITAAPDLLKACQLAQRWLANCVPTAELDGPKPLPVIAAALAKAQGADAAKAAKE